MLRRRPDRGDSVGVPAKKRALTCADVQPWLSPLVDGELAADEAQSKETHTHLADCPACKHALHRLAAVKTAVHSAAQNRRDLEVPPAAITDALTAQMDKDGQAARARGIGLAAAVVVGTAVVVAVGWQVATHTHSSPPSAALAAEQGSAAAAVAIAQAARARHSRDLPMDIATPDARRVERYLQPRLGVALQVPALHEEGFQLVGSRLVDVGEQTAGFIAYRGSYGQRLSLLVLPGQHPQDTALPKNIAGGLPATVWAGPEALWALVGEVEPTQLPALAHLIQRR
jgi:anti-sigma factor RsiW